MKISKGEDPDGASEIMPQPLGNKVYIEKTTKWQSIVFIKQIFVESLGWARVDIPQQRTRI